MDQLSNREITVDIQPQPAGNSTYLGVALYKAAERGKIKEFHEPEIESLRTPNLNTVLHLYLANHVLSDCIFDSKSARSNFVEQILHRCPSLLLQANAKGETPLHIAARYGHSDIVKFLINYGDLEKQEACRYMLRKTDLKSNTALHIAVEYGHLEVVRALLDFEDPDFSYSDNKSKETPLYIAARKGYDSLVAMILDKFKSTAACGLGGPHGRTVLHAAAMAGDAKAIVATRIILEKKGNLTKEADENGQTPLHYAAHLGHYSIVKELLKWDISAAYIADKKSAMTPLLMAARQGHGNIVREIISCCPDCCEKVDKRGWNLLHFVAVRRSPSELLEFLKGDSEAEYASIRNLIDEEDALGIRSQDVYAVYDAFLRNQTYGQEPFENNRRTNTREQIVKLFKDIVNEEVAEEPVCPIGDFRYTATCSDSSDDKKARVDSSDDKKARVYSSDDKKAKVEVQLVVATLITTVTFAAAIAVPGGYKSDNGPDQGAPLLIRDAAFKAFVITDALAFTYSLAAVGIHFKSLFSFKLLDSEEAFQLAGDYIGYAIAAFVIAFSTGTYAMLEEPSPGLAIASCCIGLSNFIWVQGDLIEFFRILIGLIKFIFQCIIEIRKMKETERIKETKKNRECNSYSQCN